MVLASGDGIYKLDYNKILEYHIQKRADITVVCKEMPEGEDLSRFGQVKADDDGRIRGYEEKPMVETSRNVSCGIYVIRRRLLIELIERAAEEDRYDLVKDILIRYKRMQGYNALWIPGTDHAAISTEVKVTKPVKRRRN